MNEEVKAQDILGNGTVSAGSDEEAGAIQGDDGGGGGRAETLAEPDEEQLLYARILQAGMFLGLALLLVTFCLYIIRVFPATVPIDHLADYWTMNVHEYLEALNHEFIHGERLMTGWAWLSMIGKGDFLNFIPIAILSAITIVCYLGITPGLIRKKDWAYASMALLEALILILAASGILAVGH